VYLSTRTLVGLLAVPLIAGGLGGLAAGQASADSPTAAPAPAGSAPPSGPAPTTAPTPAPTASAPTTTGVYQFGQRIHLLNGSGITVSQPVTFQRDPSAAGGEGMPLFVKFKITYTNNTAQTFDPTRTLTSASGGDVVGEPVMQDGLDTPSTTVPPGHSVTWWAGFGVQSRDGLQVKVAPGGDIANLDTYAVVFTDPTTKPEARPTTHRPKPTRTPAPVSADLDPKPIMPRQTPACEDQRQQLESSPDTPDIGLHQVG
jgi:hypothetical protein